MKALLTAIYNKIMGTTNTFKTAIGGRYYVDHAPQNTTFPFCCSYIISDNSDSAIFAKDDESVVIQFSIFDTNSDFTNTIDALSALDSLINHTTLSVSGYEFIKIEKDLSKLKWEDDTGTWHGIASYTVLMRK